tara:strand:- start:396 stop:1919 length:1524 start_codon:yes stop_codon:yes gene_type:complete
MDTTNNTQSNYLLRILNLVLIVSLFFLSFQAKAQQKQLPKNAQLKTFSNENYTIIGYVADDKFVEGQKITILRTPTDTIISGNYFVKDGISYLEGKGKENAIAETSIEGIFKITNSAYIDISRRDFDEIVNGGSASFKTKELTFSVNPPVNDLKFWKQFTKEIKKNPEKLPVTLLVASNLILNSIDIYFYQEYIDENTLVSLQKQGDNYALKVEFIDGVWETNASSESVQDNYTYCSNCIYRNYLNLKKIINENSENVKLTFKNGVVFTGEIYGSDHLIKTGGLNGSGKLIFSNGDTVIGCFYVAFDDKGFYNDLNPCTDSKTIFTDGTIIKGDWLEKYQKILSENEWEEIVRKSKTLTEIREKAESNEKYQYNVVEQKKKQEEGKIAEQQAERKKQIEEQEYKNALIKKYGTSWGNLIFKEEFTLGMTNEMVLEFKYGKAYKISKVARDGNYIEIWEIDPLKLEQEVIKEKGAMAFLYLAEILQTIDTKFPNLIFTNNKLTAILQH